MSIQYKSQEYPWNVGCKLQKHHKSKILSYGCVIDINKGFKRWAVGDLLELSSDAMKYAVMEPLRKKWEEDKRPKLENYIANINLEFGFNIRQEEAY